MSEEIQQEVQQPAGPSLTLADLTLALQIIQVTAQRGAIRADEMTATGNLHDKLFAFLEAQGAIQRPAPAAPASEETQGE